jgi:hypothetical protein
MDTILTKIRDLAEDNLAPISEAQEYYGGSKIFSLQYANIDASTLVVYKNGVVWAASNYTYSSTTGKVTVTGTLTTGDVLTFEYSAYEKYSTNELRGFLRSALYHLTIGKYKVFTAKSDNIIFPTPGEAEESLIAIIAVILMKGSIRQYRTPEFTITFNENLSKEQKIKQAISQFSKTFGVIDYIDTEDNLAASE